MAGSAPFIASPARRDAEFDDAFEANPALVFVRPSWIIECAVKQQRVPPTRHGIAPPHLT